MCKYLPCIEIGHSHRSKIPEGKTKEVEMTTLKIYSFPDDHHDDHDDLQEALDVMAQ